MSSVNVTKTDLNNIEEEQKALVSLDNRLLSIRKNAIFDTLKAATDARVKMITRMAKWIDKLETKIFSPNYLEELSVKETIALFKYVNGINLKVIDKIDRLEAVLNAYSKSDTPEVLSTGTQVSDLQDLKRSILEKFQQTLKTNTVDAEIVNNGDDDFTDVPKDMKEELDDLEVEIDKINLDDL